MPSITRREILAASGSASLSVLGLGCTPAVQAPQRALPRAALCTQADDWATLAARQGADPDLYRLVETLLERARRDLSLPVLERRLEGRRLLGTSREFIRRGLQWAFAFRVREEPVFLERARQEALAVAAFSDWHPDHYLDVAEMTAGMALVYDWLHPHLARADCAALGAAIVDKGIAQARHGHKTYLATNNWNQVCIGGMGLGALAVASDHPELARDVLAAARQALGKGLEAYRPDGVYPEGPGYWDYGTSYSVLTAAALRGAFAGDGGILGAPGFLRSAAFYAHAIGPSGKSFNFADAGEGAGFPCALVYLARELNQPALLACLRQSIRARQGLSDRFAPLAALWWPAPGPGQASANAFSGQGAQPVAIWRTAWDDPNALWLAVKAGGAAHNHGHMDAGSFVLECDGVRWAKDLGMQDYNSLESRGVDLWNMKQNSARWQVFRLSAQAHNTLTLDGQPHNASGMATLHMDAADAALIDLSAAFLPGQLRSATRRVQFGARSVAIEDGMQGARPGAWVRWAMSTEAEVVLDGNAALLRHKGKRLVVDLDGAGMQWFVEEIAAPRSAVDAPNPGTRQLVATGRIGPDGNWRMAVRMAPG